jgi:1,2-diacylglycerol 3-beta-glucosyltransferase
VQGLIQAICITALVLLAGYLSIVSAYMLALTFGAAMFVRRARTQDSLPRIAVLVPAHNEAAGITTTVRDLLDSRYPRRAFEVIVIADNCTDETASRARSAGAIVLERYDDSRRGKGQALDWATRERAKDLLEYDIVAFVDADMYVDPDFLSSVAGHFADPETQAVQGRYVIANPEASWLTSLGFMSFAVVNHVRPAGRTFLGGTAGLKGSGMAFRRDLICRTGWPAGSIAEDVEFGMQLLFEGVRVKYAPDAIVRSDLPIALESARVQQARWEGGNVTVRGKYLWQTLRAFLRSPRLATADALLDLLVPPLTIVVALSVTGASLAYVLAGPPAWLFAIPLLTIAAATALGMAQLKPPPRTYLHILLAPAFLAWKLALLTQIAVRPRETQWRRTPRATEKK